MYLQLNIKSQHNRNRSHWYKIILHLS